MNQNPVGLTGLEFIEFSSPTPDKMHKLFLEFGFSRTLSHKRKKVDHYGQNNIHFLLNHQPASFAESFQKAHGPCVSTMGWRVKDAEKALEIAVSRGARAASCADYEIDGKPLPAIYGIGESLIYFVDQRMGRQFYSLIGFEPTAHPNMVPSKGFLTVDHLTNNVPKGTMADWSSFYKDVFGFTEIRYFDIRGIKTGLTSFALKSPCGTFCIPINEGTEEKSQINEYLREYKGPGVQHIALMTDDIIQSLQTMKNTSIETLEIDHEYYETVFDRVPNVTEDHATLESLQILVDGDEEGYLLQIFTKNVIGPIFFEIIQRKNHHAFGEGNFGALFRSIERDQERRGVI